MSGAQVHTAGDRISRREVLHGQLWLEVPVTVVEDDGQELAVLLEPGSRFRFHEHPFGPHPWSGRECWVGPTVLQLHRDHDLYSVWRFFTNGVPQNWYINFEAPIVRHADGFDTDDYGLDLIVALDRSIHWKDVDHLNKMLRSGRMTERQVLAVLAAAEEVAGLLRAADRWWSRWDDWRP